MYLRTLNYFVAKFNKEGGAHQKNEYMECDALVKYAKTIASFGLNKILFDTGVIIYEQY